jgi:hypothetical protein
MIKMRINSRQFAKDMDNIMQYSFGFLEGVQRGKKAFYNVLGPQIAELASQFIDSNSKVSPDLLHHIYEWERVGSPKARLFDITPIISNLGITFNSSLRQSQSIKKGSKVPFYNKAQIMEDGVAVTIRPVRAQALRFEIGGEEIYTSNEVTVENPGGQTQGQFKNAVANFFGVYFRQSFLQASGIQQYLENPIVYKKNLQKGKARGKVEGIKTGYRWIVSAGAIG